MKCGMEEALWFLELIYYCYNHEMKARWTGMQLSWGDKKCTKNVCEKTSKNTSKSEKEQEDY
jgi:hypothetical protein